MKPAPAAVELLNVGAGVNFTAVAAMGNTNVLTLTQKTAGALTVTLDVDNTKTTNNGGAGWDSATDVKASNATSLRRCSITAMLLNRQLLSRTCSP